MDLLYVTGTPRQSNVSVNAILVGKEIDARLRPLAIAKIGIPVKMVVQILVHFH